VPMTALCCHGAAVGPSSSSCPAAMPALPAISSRCATSVNTAWTAAKTGTWNRSAARMVKRGRRCPPVRAMLRQQCPQADSHQVVRGEGRHALRHHHPVIAHEQRIVSGRAPNGVWVGRPCCAPRGRWGQTWHPDASRPCLPLPSPRRDAVGLVPQRGDAARSRDRRIALPPAPQGRHHRQGLAAARAHSRRRAAGAGQRRYPNAAPTDEVGPVPVAVRRPRRVSRDSPQLLMATTGDRSWVRKRQLSWTRRRCPSPWASRARFGCRSY
jgi:hypothetical protein